MSKVIESAKLFGTYVELGNAVSRGTFSENAEEKAARTESMNACREIIGGAYPMAEVQAAIKEGKEEFKKEFPNS